MTHGDGDTPLEDAPPASTATLVAARTDDGGNGATAVADDTVAETRPTDGAMAYNPALDGIRGLAVAAVLLFHGGFSWARGGYLGVSTFFTLSGFLITSLLITEHKRSGRITLTAFWARRLRRLLPAAAVTLAVVMLTVFLTDQLWERKLGGDVIAAALNVANWRFLADDQSYAALFDENARSPVLHFWSLAIEEQFYWVFPLLAAGVLGWAKGSLRTFGGVLLGLLGLSAVLTFLYNDSHDTVYYSTPIRMGEILVGALLAVGLALTRGRLTTAEGERSARTSVVATLVGAVALGASAWAWWNVEQDTEQLYQGGLLAYALLSGGLVFAACVTGPVRRLLAFEPLRLLGLISYGVYLIHWPVFLLMDEKWVDARLDPFNLEPRGTVLFALRVAVTLVLAIASYRWLEQPIRRGRRPKVVKAPLLAAGSVASIVLLAVVVPEVTDPPVDPFGEEAQRDREEEYLEKLAGLPPEKLAPDAKIGVTYGDSTMIKAAFGLSDWGWQTRRLVLFGPDGGIGCNITASLGGEVRYGPDAQPVSADPQCVNQTSEAIDVHGTRLRDRYGRVDFVMMMAGPWDVSDRLFPGDQWRHIGDAEFDRVLRGEIEKATDTFLQQGMTVVWVTQPYMREHDGPAGEHARMDAFNQMITEVADSREGVVIVDLATWVNDLPREEDERLRTDGTHFDDDTTTEVSESFLGEEILKAADREHSPFPPPAPPPTTGDGGT